MREKLNREVLRIRFIEFPEFLGNSVVPEHNSIPLTVALQHQFFLSLNLNLNLDLCCQRHHPNSGGREGIWDFGLRIRNYVEKNWVEYEDKEIAAILRPFHQRDLFREIRGL